MANIIGLNLEFETLKIEGKSVVSQIPIHLRYSRTLSQCPLISYDTITVSYTTTTGNNIYSVATKRDLNYIRRLENSLLENTFILPQLGIEPMTSYMLSTLSELQTRRHKTMFLRKFL